jgi:hypothetical protein
MKKKKKYLFSCCNVPFALTRLPHDKFQGNYFSFQRQITAFASIGQIP